jgi:hypothetical protein
MRTRAMSKQSIVMLAIFIAGCASAPMSESVLTKNDAVDDFIRVAELEPLDSIRSSGLQGHKRITDTYIILPVRQKAYLLVFYRRCHELTDNVVTPDERRDRNSINARFDTFRGCRIKSLYEVTKGQADELIALGNAPNQ